MNSQHPATSDGSWWAPWSHRHGELDTARMSARDLLIAGVREYRDQAAPLVRPIMAEMAGHQAPSHLFITCADSRIVPNVITASGPGDLFTIRNVGNLVPRHGSGMPDDSVAAGLEYALNALHVRTVTVCGHSGCGAMAALLHPEHAAGLPHLSRWLDHGRPTLAHYRSEGREPQRLDELCRRNVVQQLDNLLTYPDVKHLVAAGELDLVGMFFDLESAQVWVLDRQREAFAAI